MAVRGAPVHRGNIAVASSFVFYDSLLPHIASPDEIDRVSTAAYAVGYLGGGICS
jgi:MFS transporter, UMF1 family